jgi:hypothetical protein
VGIVRGTWKSNLKLFWEGAAFSQTGGGVKNVFMVTVIPGGKSCPSINLRLVYKSAFDSCNFAQLEKEHLHF